MMTSGAEVTVRRPPPSHALRLSAENTNASEKGPRSVKRFREQLPSWMPPQIGDVIDGRFELRQLAGTGGMGNVFEALDLSTGSAVALKIMFEEVDLAAVRFEREASVLASLHHDGIVQYIVHGRTDTSAYLAMEWLRGEDLARRLMRRRLSVAEALVLGVRVGEALEAMHAQDIVHRDIKPGNIFLIEGKVERAKILDLGLARTGGPPLVTKTGMMLGTLGYMPPEQVYSESHIDARADVFSLGCVLFKALTGAYVFTGASIMAIVSKILHDDPPRLRDHCPEAPAELDALITRMVAKDPNDRPRDGGEVAAALRALRG